MFSRETALAKLVQKFGGEGSDLNALAKNFRALALWTEAAKDIWAMRNQDGFPTVTEWPQGTLVVVNDDLYIQKNGAWVQVLDSTSGVGSLLDYQFVRKTGNQNKASDTTLSDDTELLLPVGANQIWEFTCMLHTDVSGAARIKAVMAGPAGSTIRTGVFAKSDANDTVFVTSDGTAISFGAGGADPQLFRGLIRTAGTAGNLSVQWAQQVSIASTITVKTDSFLTANRVA